MVPNVSSPSPSLHSEYGPALVRFARACLRAKLGGTKADVPTGAWCDARAATFVTLRWRDGRLQGCIGSLEAKRGIVDDVAHNALAAALLDPRADTLEAHHIDDLVFELSILSPLVPLSFVDEASALRQIRPGVDGVVLAWAGGRATFLPSMWPRLRTTDALIGALKKKAGMDRAWGDDVKLWTYTVEKFVDGPALTDALS
jgi:AmmeMemoRadiSam system protein A